MDNKGQRFHSIRSKLRILDSSGFKSLTLSQLLKFNLERVVSPDSGVKSSMLPQSLMFKSERAESPESGVKSLMFPQ